MRWKLEQSSREQRVPLGWAGVPSDLEVCVVDRGGASGGNLTMALMQVRKQSLPGHRQAEHPKRATGVAL